MLAADPIIDGNDDLRLGDPEIEYPKSEYRSSNGVVPDDTIASNLYQKTGKASVLSKSGYIPLTGAEQFDRLAYGTEDFNRWNANLTGKTVLKQKGWFKRDLKNIVEVDAHGYEFSLAERYGFNQ